MPSVATPEYVIRIENPTPQLPPVAERTAAMTMEAIKAWPYWLDIQRVALKEYGMSPDLFASLLPEYQRYLCLIMLGHSPLGMFSFNIDKIWHSQVLCSHLWGDFCLRLHGTLINHVAQVPTAEEDAAICVTCRSCTNCSGGGQGGGQGGGKELQGTAQEFAQAYHKAFGSWPSTAIWDLDEAEGCAAL